MFRDFCLTHYLACLGSNPITRDRPPFMADLILAGLWKQLEVWGQFVLKECGLDPTWGLEVRFGTGFQSCFISFGIRYW